MFACVQILATSAGEAGTPANQLLISLDMCHVSHVTCQVSHVMRVCYQRGLPRLVFFHNKFPFSVYVHVHSDFKSLVCKIITKHEVHA